MLPRVIVTVGAVDLCAFQGRELHPKAEDAGKCGVVVSAESFPVDTRPGDEYEPEEYLCVRVRLSDGRVVELLPHEIAAIAIEEAA